MKIQIISTSKDGNRALARIQFKGQTYTRSLARGLETGIWWGWNSDNTVFIRYSL